MTVTVESVWPAAREMLRTMLNPDIFNLWFAPIRATAMEGDHLTLEVANDFCEVWLKDNYLGLIQDVLMHACGQPLKVKFKVAATQPGATAATEGKAHKANAVEEREESVVSCRDHGFNPKNTFDTFVVGTECMQEEFFHTFNALHEAHKQLVLTCDRPANEIQNREQRLVSRFEWGLVTDLQPPDVETRVAILRKKEKSLGVELPEEIINFLANRIRTNIRRLEGALIRVASYASLTGKKLSLEVVEGLLREVLHEEGRFSISIELIQKKVAEHFDIRLADMTSKRRPENIAFPRQVAMFLARQLTESSLNTIGEAFGGRDHGTVLHACRLVKDRMEIDPNVRQAVHYLEKQLQR